MHPKLRGRDKATELTQADAYATIYSIVLGAVADTADRTGLRAGPASEAMIAAIVKALLERRNIEQLLQAAKG
jgi:hypothetical protein